MPATTTRDSFYITGGTLPANATSYVERQADKDLLAGLLAREYCYALNTRQMGKSSLMVRTAVKLREEGVTVAILDLTAIGQNLTPEQWYDGLQDSLAEQLGLEEELEAFWNENRHLGPLQRFLGAIRRVVLPKTTGRIVLFVDEIDAVRSLPFPADEFFAGIRALYNARTESQDASRITFCLLGVATPADLISDTRMSPFNVGRRIQITDFTPEEAKPLAARLRGGESTLARILWWTGGNPYMTQRLCEAVEQTGDKADVDRTCESLFLTKAAQDSDDNLAFVRNRLIRSEADLASLLDLYRKVRTGKHVPDDETNPLCDILKLSGVAKEEGGLLVVRNRIYDRVFDREWVQAHMPDAEVRRQMAAYRRGLFRAIAVSSVVVAVMGVLTIEALTLKSRSDANARRADKNAALARTEANKANYNLYVDHIHLAQTGWAENNMSQVEELLKETESNPARGWEWGYFNRLCHLDQLTLPHAAEVVYSAAFSPDGRRIVTGCSDSTARVWDVETGRELFPIKGHAREIRFVSFTPDGRRIVTGSYDHGVKVCDAETGRELRALQGNLRGDRTSVALSSDGSRIAIASGESSTESGEVRVFKAATGRRLLTVRERGTAILSVAFSPDGHHLLIGGLNGIVTALNAATGREERAFQTHQGGIQSVAYSAGGKRFVTGGWDATAKVWSAETGREIFTLKGHVRAVWSVAYSPDDSRIVTGSEDHSVKVWDAKSGHPQLILKGHAGEVFSVAFSPDGRRIITGSNDHTAKVWDAESVRERGVLKVPAGFGVFGIAFSRDGKRIAAANVSDDLKEGMPTIWDTETGRGPLSLRGNRSPLYSLVFTSDGRRLLAGGGYVDGANGEATLWDAVTGQVLFTLKGRTGPFWQVAISSDASRLATASASTADGGSGDTTIWDLQTGKKLFSPQGLTDRAFSVAFSPDGKRLAIGRGEEATKSGVVTVWDMQTRKELVALKGHTQRVHGIAFSPDGKRIVTGAGNFDTPGEAKVWDAQTGREQLPLKGHFGAVWSVAFSPDGKRIVTGSLDNTARVWDAKTGRELLTLKGHTNRVYSVAFSPDGKSIATGSGDGTVSLWYSDDGYMRSQTGKQVDVKTRTSR